MCRQSACHSSRPDGPSLIGWIRKGPQFPDGQRLHAECEPRWGLVEPDAWRPAEGDGSGVPRGGGGQGGRGGHGPRAPAL